MATDFFSGLADELARRGHNVHRINFNGGDAVFWPRPGAAHFRGGLKAWPTFLERRLRDWAISDIILFGDLRPLHVAAIEVARRAGVKVHVVEEGYLRPNWVTIEDEGVNGRSTLPRDPRWYRSRAMRLPPWTDGRQITGEFSRRAWQDVVYNVSSLVLSPLYPGYRTHRPWHPLVEYAGWIWRLVNGRGDRRRSARAIGALKAGGRPYYLFPLQLDCDTQIRLNSTFGRVRPSIERVVESFGRHAPSDAMLVIKEHPLDNRLTAWSGVVRAAARRAGVSDRVIFIEDAPIERLLPQTRGVVTVNSTVGVMALAAGLPVKALGNAIYDMEGLTFAGDLDAFWTGGRAPDAGTFDAFRRVLAHLTQVNGGFFSGDALRLAIVGAVDKLEGSRTECDLTPILSDESAAPFPDKIARRA